MQSFQIQRERGTGRSDWRDRDVIEAKSAQAALKSYLPTHCRPRKNMARNSKGVLFRAVPV